jgi:hypothetical protein
MTHMALAVNRNVPPIKATSKQAAYSDMMSSITSSIPVNHRLPLDSACWQKGDLRQWVDCFCGGELTSPHGGVKPPLHQIDREGEMIHTVTPPAHDPTLQLNLREAPWSAVAAATAFFWAYVIVAELGRR